VAAATPRVVFIAQLGTGGDSWRPVLDRLPGITSVTYDRPGTGSAEPRPAPNPPLPHSAFARELACLLDQRGITEPVVLVGHSFGGLIARAFAGLWSERVAGLVFVDASIPQFHLLPTCEPKLDGDGAGATEIDVVAGQVEILTAAVPSVPTVVLTRTHGRWSGYESPPHPAVEDLWLVSQNILSWTFQAPLIVADDASHQIPDEAPDLVAYAVGRVVHAAREGTPVHLNTDELTLRGGHLAAVVSDGDTSAALSSRT
jgi:pimeloyl-ACP methyl ester carboxylesterase